MKVLLYLLLVAVSCLTGAAHAGFAHPGAMHSAAELSLLKLAHHAGGPQWDDFNRQAERALVAPLPVAQPEFYCGRALQGARSDPSCRSMKYDAQRAYTLALQWYLTGDDRYGDRSLTILRTWFTQFRAIRGFDKAGKRIDDRGQSGLEASWAAAHFVNAAEIMRYANRHQTAWTKNDTGQFNAFLNRLLAEMNEAPEGASYSNAVWSEIEAKLAIAIFQDNQADFDAAVALWRERVKPSIYMKSDGTQPLHVPARSGRALVHDWNFPMGFHSGTMADGHQAETCRDLNHTDMAFRSQTYSAHMAFNQGVDLFDAHKVRLGAFMELHNRMRQGQTSAQVCKEAGLFHVTNKLLKQALKQSSGSASGNARRAALIQATRERIAWKRTETTVLPGDSQVYAAALRELGGEQAVDTWLEQLMHEKNDKAFARQLDALAVVADVRHWQAWPDRAATVAATALRHIRVAVMRISGTWLMSIWRKGWAWNCRPQKPRLNAMPVTTSEQPQSSSLDCPSGRV